MNNVVRIPLYERQNTDLGFENLAGADAAGAHVRAGDRSIKIDLDPLQVGHKTAQRFSDDLRTGTAGSFNLTAPLILGSRHGAFMADNAFFGHVFSFR